MKILVSLCIIFFNSAAFARVDCAEFISTLPKDFFTGYVSVPEDWNNESGRKIDIFYYGRKNPNNHLASVAFFNGGPSSDSHGSYELIKNHPESNKVNFIYIDQRGTGCSDPYPNESTIESAKRLTHYTTRSIVKDSEEIRKKLLGKNTKWKIFGQSYGGMIVHRYISMFPESIDKAYAHGYAIMTDQIEWIKYRILSQKRVSEDYFNLYPQDRSDLEKIKSMIPNDQCFTDNDISLCGPIFMDILRHPLGFHDSWEEMHWWIENLATFFKDEPNMIQGFSNFYFTDFTHDSLPSLVINKVEITKGPSDRDECLEAFRRLKKDGDDPELWAINECRVLIALENRKFDTVLDSVTDIDPLTLDSVKVALLKFPNLSLFLYSGQKDVFVPVETFVEEAQRLNGLIDYKIFPTSGHEGFNTEQAIWDDLLK